MYQIINKLTYKFILFKKSIILFYYLIDYFMVHEFIVSASPIKVGEWG